MKKSVLTYIEGTNYISKFNVSRHLSGQGHQMALRSEQYVCMYVCKTLFNHASLGQLYAAGFHEGRHTNTKRYIN